MLLLGLSGADHARAWLLDLGHIDLPFEVVVPVVRGM